MAEKKYAHFFQNLVDVPLPTAAKMAILRSSATCAMTFLVQTHLENETSTAVAFFDKTVSACAQCILELGDAETNSAITQQLLHLPARMGGLGLTSQTAVASAAHAAATTTISHRQALQQIHDAAHGYPC